MVAAIKVTIVAMPAVRLMMATLVVEMRRR